MLELLIDKLLYRDHQPIPFRPEWTQFTDGSLVAAIYLQQVYFYSCLTNKEDGVFYKFNAPNDHSLYKKGDSWIETLGWTEEPGKKTGKGITENIFTRHRDKVSTKVTPSTRPPHRAFDDNGEMLPPNHLVYYWTDMSNITWYTLNQPLFYAYVVTTLTGMSPDEYRDTYHRKPENLISENEVFGDSETEKTSVLHITEIPERTNDPYAFTKIPKVSPTVKVTSSERQTEHTALENYILELSGAKSLTIAQGKSLKIPDKITEGKESVEITAIDLYDRSALYREYIHKDFTEYMQKSKHSISGKINVGKIIDSLKTFRGFETWLKRNNKKFFRQASDKLEVLE